MCERNLNMTDAVSVEVATTKKPRQGRSPAYPFVSLRTALARAETFRVAEGGRPRHFSPMTATAKAWGMGAKTGDAKQTVAALGHYGLFEFQGAAENRSARLTELALNILLDKQPVSAERDALIRDAALKPRIHAELWQKWQAALPSNATLETYLVRDRGFSETGARDLMTEYKDTIAFAKLGQPDTIPLASEASPNSGTPAKKDVEIGDLIQREVDGVLTLEKNSRVRAIRDLDGQTWAFIDGSEAGIPMEQVIVQEKGKGAVKPPNAPPMLPEDDPSPPPGTRKEVFALDEGDVVLTFPEEMSAASFEDLDGYFKLFLKKARRRAGVSSDKGE
jgi:hypothetical protein